MRNWIKQMRNDWWRQVKLRLDYWFDYWTWREIGGLIHNSAFIQTNSEIQTEDIQFNLNLIDEFVAELMNAAISWKNKSNLTKTEGIITLIGLLIAWIAAFILINLGNSNF